MNNLVPKVFLLPSPGKTLRTRLADEQIFELFIEERRMFCSYENKETLNNDKQRANFAFMKKVILKFSLSHGTMPFICMMKYLLKT